MNNECLFKPIQTKLYKTAQTRGADDDVIYQNRVKRNSTVLIPYEDYEMCMQNPVYNGVYENGYIVLIKPEEYFNTKTRCKLKKQRLKLGDNLLVFYETRRQWDKYPINKNWTVPNSRKAPLGGEYIARIPATTSASMKKISLGYNTTSLKGAGIRVYEYADSKTIDLCRLQLEYIFWLCYDVDDFLYMCSDKERKELTKRRDKIMQAAVEKGVADRKKLLDARIINEKGHTICPLCLKEISAIDFASKMVQAEGREVPDLTVTNVSLFHIQELRTGQFNHKLYNLGWGHHLCNVTIADKGVANTLKWMKDILLANGLI